MEPDDDKTRLVVVLSKGTVIGHYRIVEKIGAGGMGEVYLAEDTELDRRVALKFLPNHLCQDADCRARFKREAQSVAKVDHPNIVSVFEVGEFQDRPFFAMQHVEGQTLKEVIAGKTLPLDRILEIGIQVCDGLQAAHDKGITHRDIKPSNILIDSHGRARIVDFGLASVLGSDPLTKTGSTLGTVGYMSPEQVRGEKVDHRTDLFSLGVVLYELITGHSPFKSESEAATLHAITDAKPELMARFRREMPDGVQTIIDKALEKDVATRYQHADDLAADLKRCVRQSGEHPSYGASLTAKKRFVLPVSIGALLVLVIGGIFLWPRQVAISPATHRQITFSGKVSSPAISPDGQFIAYVCTDSPSVRRLCVQDVAGGKPLPIFTAANIDRCRWSPDGSRLIFRALSQGMKYQTCIIPRLGGTVRDLANCQFIAWSPDGAFVACCRTYEKKVRLMELASGREIEIPLTGVFTWLHDVDWSPNGEELLIRTYDERNYMISVISVDGIIQNVVLQDSSEILCPRWAPKGDAIYFQKNNGQTKDLMKVKISSSTGLAKSPPVTLLSGLQVGDDFSVSENGKQLLHTREQSFSNLWSVLLEIAGRDTSIKTYQITAGTSNVVQPCISPNGKQVAFVMGNSKKANIFVTPFEGGQMRQLTYFESRSCRPVWSPDGQEIAFGSDQNGLSKVWHVDLTGNAPKPFEKTQSAAGDNCELEWAPSRDIFYRRPGNRNFVILDPRTEEEHTFLPTDTLGWMLRLICSTDGLRVSASWNRRDKARTNLWVISAGGETQLELQTGRVWPMGWSHDGTQIYATRISNTDLLNPDVLKFPVNGGQPTPHLRLPFDRITWVSNMTQDGKMVVCAVEQFQSDVWLVENFDPEVK